MFSKNIQNVGLILGLVLFSSVIGNSFGNYHMVLAIDVPYDCDSAQEVYNDVIRNINHEVNLAYHDEVSEEVANFVSNPPLSDSIGEANKAFDYVTKECSVPESIVKHFADYNQNIYDSLDLYRGTTPHAIPEFGSIVMLILVVSVIGVIISARKFRF